MNGARVFIMHPQKLNYNSVTKKATYLKGPHYPTKLAKLKRAIKRLLPKDAQFATEYLYEAQEDDNPLDGGGPHQAEPDDSPANPSGRGLFEYDPDDGNGVAEVRIMFENGGGKNNQQPPYPGGPWTFKIENGALEPA